MISLHVAFNTLLTEICNVQLDRLVKEFIVPLEKQIRSGEQDQKQVVENETREIVGKKRRAPRTGMSSTSASKAEMVAAGGTRRSKRVKVAPTRYAPVVEEESWTTSPHASSGVVTTTLAASLLDESSQRQVVNFIKSKNTMIRHDGYNEEDLMNDCEDDRNMELCFDDISSISFTEKDWGSSLQLEYQKDGKDEKFQYSIAQDWVKYPAKEPTKYMKVDWEPFVQYIKDRRKFTK